MTQRRFFIATFGCQMNVYDSGRLASMMEKNGWLKTSDKSEADFIFINTCSIREKAVTRVISNLKQLKPLKKENPSLLIGVGGCIAEQEGAKLLDELPFVSLVAGPRRLGEIPEILANYRPGDPPLILSGDPAKPTEEPFSPKSAPLTSFITIMEGCNNFCAYCVVPYLRGPEKSRRPGDIINEAKGLIEAGTREITLLGQNVNSYQSDSDNSGKAPPFVELLKSLDRLKGLERLRFTTSHPKDVPLELVELFGNLPSLCEHFHLPVQSGSDRILSAMGRNYTVKKYNQTIENLRKFCPKIALSTDIIVGFPGETEADFSETVSLLKENRYDSIFSFKYSDRPQTRALSLPHKIDEEEKARRLETVLAIQKEITMEKNRALIGQTLEVLVTGPGRYPGQLTGYSRELKIVNFDGPSQLTGQLSKVTITDAWPASLAGQFRETSQ